MRAVGWVGIAALTLLAGAASAEAQPPKSKGMPDGWWSGLLSESKPKEDPRAAAPKGPTVEEKEREMDRLLKAFQRREAVCERLTAIAQDTGNAALLDESERLYQLACALYERQTPALGMGVAAATTEAAEVLEPYELPRPAREPTLGITPSRLRSGGLSAGTSEPSRSWEGQR